MKRFDVEIDDTLMREALRATGLQTEADVVKLGLETLVRIHQQGRLRDLRGKVDWQGDLGEMRS